MNRLQLDLPILLPDIDAKDECVRHLTDRLVGVRGVENAHIVHDNGTAKLCLHYDPNLVPLAKLERLVHEAGALVTDRYSHETLALEGLDVADAADTLTDRLAQIPGMLHANANYAAGLLFVAYDSEVLSRSEVERAIGGMGARL